MSQLTPARCLTLLLLMASSFSGAQTALPPTPPTSAAVPAVTSSSANTPAITSRPASNLAQVTYRDGQIEIVAENSSLNQILRDIARFTGMTITGGVMEQRVFGRYGPGQPADILSALLEGTGTNLLYRQTSDAAPAELILTPRQGGPTPPGPGPAYLEDAVPAMADAPAASPMQPPPPQPQWTPSLPAREQGGSPAAAPPATEPTQSQSPDSVRTPQQIYEQLQQLQKAQAKH